MKEWSRTIILITIPNSLNKSAFSKYMINIFNIMAAKITFNRDLYLSSREKSISRENTPNNQPKEKLNLRKEILFPCPFQHFGFRVARRLSHCPSS